MKASAVAVTGLGLITGLGLDLESSWKALLEGKNPVRQFQSFDPTGLGTTFGVELPEGADELFARHIMRRNRRLMTRGTMTALVSALMAVADSGLDLERLDRRRVGVVVGGTGTGYAPATGEIDEHRILRNMQSSPAAWISLKGKFTGPSFVVSTACSSGAYALGAAHGLIASGECDIVISGAADSSINYLDVQGFCSLMALAEETDDIATASRPFDKAREGFVIGEGGGMLVLENAKFAASRGARVYAAMPSPGLDSEAYNILSPRPGGHGMALSMTKALDVAGLKPEQIDYLNAHGTSTPLNDLYETEAIKTVFGAHSRHLPVSSTKSMTGHCLAGAAGIEAVICCLAIHERIIPATINLTDPDPALDLDFVPEGPRKKALTHVMSNSFAFGGHNGVRFSRGMSSGANISARIAGSGTYLPGEPVPFESIDTVLGELTDAPPRLRRWIKSTSTVMKELLDIEFVHYAIDPVTREFTDDNVTMSVKAARRAIEAAGISPGEIDLICYGSAHQDQMPTASVRIQEALGIERCDEFSIHANCTSAYKALYLAHELIKAGRNRLALVVSSGISSSELRAEYFNQALVDKESLFLRWFLSDGAGALVLAAGEGRAGGFEVEHSYIESIGGRKPSLMFNHRPALWLNPRQEYEEGLHHLRQSFRNALSTGVFEEEGQSVFVGGLQRMLRQGRIPVEKIRFLQVNLPAKHIVDSVAEECALIGIPPDRLYTRLAETGYSGPPMALICLDKIIREEQLPAGERIVSFVTEVSKFMQAGYSVKYAGPR